MIRRMYYDESEWETISDEVALAVFNDNFYDGQIVLDSLKSDGFPIDTNNARYEYFERGKI